MLAKMGTLRSLVCGLMMLASSAAGLETNLDSFVLPVSSKPETTYFEARGEIFGFKFDRKVIGKIISESGKPKEFFLPVPSFDAVNVDSTEYSMKVENDSVYSQERFPKNYSISRSITLPFSERTKDALYLFSRFLLCKEEKDVDSIKEDYPLAFSVGERLYFGDGFCFGRIKLRKKANNLYLDVYSDKIKPYVIPSRTVTFVCSINNGNISIDGIRATLFGIFPAQFTYKTLN